MRLCFSVHVRYAMLLRPFFFTFRDRSYSDPFEVLRNGRNFSVEEENAAKKTTDPV